MTRTRPDPTDYDGLPWSRGSEYAAIAGFWTFLALLEVLRRAVDPFRPFGAETRTAVVVAGAAIYVVWALLTPLVFRLTDRFPLARDAIARRLLFHLAVGLVVALAVEALNFTFIRSVVVQAVPGGGGPPFPRPGTGTALGVPLGSDSAAVLPTRPPRFGLGALVGRLWFLDEFLTYVALLATGAARHTLVRLRDREREAAALQEEGVTLKAEQATLHAEQATLKAERAELEAQLADARLAALRMQLNPHFLFNTLHAIGSLADEDPAGVQRVVARLSSLLRRTLEGTARKEVPLAEELSFLHDYLEIQKVRFAGTLRVHERVDVAARDALVPTLVLQPLVENAFEHAFSARGGGLLTLSARIDGDQLVLGVRDDGPGLEAAVGDPTKGRGGIGLANTRDRLDALYGDTARLDLVEPEDGGLLVAVTLPFHTADDLRAAVAP